MGRHRKITPEELAAEMAKTGQSETAATATLEANSDDASSVSEIQNDDTTAERQLIDDLEWKVASVESELADSKIETEQYKAKLLASYKVLSQAEKNLIKPGMAGTAGIVRHFLADLQAWLGEDAEEADKIVRAPRPPIAPPKPYVPPKTMPGMPFVMNSGTGPVTPTPTASTSPVTQVPYTPQLKTITAPDGTPIQANVRPMTQPSPAMALIPGAEPLTPREMIS
jgi:uncharacterized protein YfcZ (UPF0381/DUF406 family)